MLFPDLGTWNPFGIEDGFSCLPVDERGDDVSVPKRVLRALLFFASSSLLFPGLGPPRAVPRPLLRIAPRGPRGADITATMWTDLSLLTRAHEELGYAEDSREQSVEQYTNVFGDWS